MSTSLIKRVYILEFFLPTEIFLVVFSFFYYLADSVDVGVAELEFIVPVLDRGVLRDIHTLVLPSQIFSQ